MHSSHFFTMGLFYIFVMAPFSIFLCFYEKGLFRRVTLFLLSLGAVVGVCFVGTWVYPNKNSIQATLQEVLSKNPRHVLCAALGVVFALPWLSWTFSKIPKSPLPDVKLSFWKNFSLVIPILILTFSSFGGLVGISAIIYNDTFRDDMELSVGDGRFSVKQIGVTEFLPIRIAVDENENLYVTSDFSDNGFEYGVITKYTSSHNDSQWESKEIARSAVLYRPYGLAIHNGDIYVSRSGRLAKAKNGRVTYVQSGAVTQLRDLDGDGYFEYFDDVVPGLPGSQGPDTQHQNNGIIFDENSNLYLTQGVSPNRSPFLHQFEGAILKASNDFKNIEIFASGFRNPFPLVFGPEKELFTIDNDANSNPGDELNHVRKGKHYGHPYFIGKDQDSQDNITSPVFTGDPSYIIYSMAYTESKDLPEKYSGCFYISTSKNKIIRLRLKKNGDSFEIAEKEEFASVPSPIDLTISKKGIMYVLSRFSKKIYSIQLK